jgi:hypothetical protein
MGVRVSEKDVTPLLLEFYSFNGWKDEALNAFKQLKSGVPANKSLPDRVIGDVMQLHLAYENWEAALELYNEARESRDIRVHDCAIRAYVGLQQLKEAREVLKSVCDDRLVKFSSFAPVVQLCVKQEEATALKEYVICNIHLRCHRYSFLMSHLWIQSS